MPKDISATKSLRPTGAMNIETRRSLHELNRSIPQLVKKPQCPTDLISGIENLTLAGSGVKTEANTAAAHRELRRLNRETIRAKKGPGGMNLAQLETDDMKTETPQVAIASISPLTKSESSQSDNSPSMMEDYERLSQKVTKLKKRIQRLTRELALRDMELEKIEEQNVELTNRFKVAEERALFESQEQFKCAEALAVERGVVEALQEALQAAGVDYPMGFSQRTGFV